MDHKTIVDNYLNNLNNGTFIITEDKDDIQKVSQAFKQILRKFKVSGKEKQKVNKQINKIQKSKNFKKVQLAIKNSSKNGKFDESRFKKEIADLCDYAKGNFISILASVFFGLQHYAEKRLFKIETAPIVIFSLLVIILLELPGPIIIKLITKTERKLLDIQKEMRIEGEKISFSFQSMLLVVLSIGIIVASFATTHAGVQSIIFAGSILNILSALSKFIYGIFLGVRLNSWKYYEKLVKQKVGMESVQTSIDYIDTLMFISSLRENLISLVTRVESKEFILNQATDYEILYFVVEGKFPKNINDNNYEDILEILNISLNTNFVPINEIGLSTKGITAGILLETIISSSIFTNQLLTEGVVDHNKLKELDRLRKLAKKNLAVAMKKNNEENIKNNTFETSSNHYTAGNDFNNAKKRYDQYKKTGEDPGKKAYSNGRPGTTRGSEYTYTGEPSDADRAAWGEYINKIFTFSPSIAIKNILSKVYGASKLSKVLGTSPALSGFLIALSGVALASIFMFASYKAYQRLMGAAASFCRKEKIGKNTGICIKKFELKGIKERIVDLKKVIKFCDKLEKEEQRPCQITLRSKINSLGKEAKEIQTFLKNSN